MNFFLIKHVLYAVNGVYLIIATILIALAAYVRLSAYITSVSIVGGIIACGVFLGLLALLGFLGTARHSQAVLFFYIILLFSLFLIQFSVACACLTLSTVDQLSIVATAWSKSNMGTKVAMMSALQCYGFETPDKPPSDKLGTIRCEEVKLSCQCPPEQYRQSQSNVTNVITATTTTMVTTTVCPSCWSVIEQKLEHGIRVTGTVGLFFSLVELVGVWLALQYRHKRDPSIDPNHML